MSAQIIYGVVFGKPKIEKAPEPFVEITYAEIQDMYLKSSEPFSDDVFYMSPPVQLPSDSERAE